MSAAATITAFFAATAAISALLRSPLANRLVNAPTGERWHARPTPLVGGIGIVGGLLAGAGSALAVGAVEPTPELLGILGGCVVLFLAGLADDLFSLSPLVKVAAQLAAVGIVLASGVRVEIVGNDALALAIAVVWLIGMTNAFNLLDNMDGLAATLAAIACGFFAIAAATVQPDRMVLVLSLSVGLACAGFLPFNLRRSGSARVFMGDSGSQVLGFALAVLGLSASWTLAGTTVATLLLPILVLAVPILDTALVSVVRLLEGRPIYRGGRDHSSHRLVYHGLSEKRAVILLAVVSAALGGTSLAYYVLENARITLVGVLLSFAALVQFGSFLSDVERRPAAAARTEGNVFLRTFVVHRRRLIEVAVDSALVTAGFTAAYLLRLEGSGTITQRHVWNLAIPVILFARLAAFVPFGLYSGVWRHAGANEAVRIVAAVLGSSLAAFVFLSWTIDWNDFPREVLVIDALLCVILIGASRFGERALVRALARFQSRTSERRTVIVGAGRGGRSLLGELRDTPNERVVGFVDDDPDLRRRRLSGVPVLGRTDEMGSVLAATRADRVLVTIPDAPRERLDSVVRHCSSAGVPCRFVRREVDLQPYAVLGAAAE